MTLSDLCWFLVGDADTIRRLAANPWSLVIGALLVLTAGLARNYDSHDLQRRWWRLLLPFAASTLAAALLFAVVALLIEAGASITPLGWGILGLFWLTGPFAWLYGLPFEHYLNPAQARTARRWTLAFVAFCRVALMTRCVSVLCGCSTEDALLIVLCFAAPTALLAVAFAAGFVRRPEAGNPARRRADDSAVPHGSILLGATRTVVDGMGGVRLVDTETFEPYEGPQPPIPPEPWFRLQRDDAGALGRTLGCLAILLLVGATLILSRELVRGGRQPPASPEPVFVSPSPELWGFTATALLFWSVLAALRQPRHRRRTKYIRGLQQGDVSATLRVLDTQSPNTFPPRWDPSVAVASAGYAARMLEAMQVAADLPPTSWVRPCFLRRLGHLLPGWLDSFDARLMADDRMSEAQLRDLARLRDLLRRLPDGAELLQPYRKYLEELAEYTPERDPPRHVILAELLAMAQKEVTSE